MPPYLSTPQSEVIGLGEVEEFFLVLNGFGGGNLSSISKEEGHKDLSGPSGIRCFL